MIVEFIGTQGIGKSTLFNTCQPSISDRWLFRDDLRKASPVSVDTGQIEYLHHALYLRRIERLCADDLNAWQTILTGRQISRVMYESLFITSHTFPKGFLLEEGLFKNFPQEVLDLSDEEAEPLWKSRAFVHLRARESDLAVARYQRRVAERRDRGIFQHQRSDQEVRSRVEADNMLFDQMVEKAKVFSCPEIVVYAEDSLQDVVQNVLDFERSLCFGPEN